MKLRYEKDIKNEVVDELRKFKAERVYLEYKFDISMKEGILSVRGYRKDKEIRMSYLLETLHNVRYKELIISDMEVNNVFLDMILEREISLELYSKNIKGIKLNGNSTDYWIDTVVVKAGEKVIRHDAICFDGVQMIKRV